LRRWQDGRWAEEELKGIDLGDRRLDKRAIALLDTLSAKTDGEYPVGVFGWSETIAAYRFLAMMTLRGRAILAPALVVLADDGSPATRSC
jgi:hypothetical protein